MGFSIFCWRPPFFWKPFLKLKHSSPIFTHDLPRNGRRHLSTSPQDLLLDGHVTSQAPEDRIFGWKMPHGTWITAYSHPQVDGKSWKFWWKMMENDENHHWISRDSRDVRDVLVHLFGNDFLQPSEMWESSQMAWLIGMPRGRYLENPSRNQRLENPRTKCRFPAGKIIEREILDFQLPRLIIRV